MNFDITDIALNDFHWRGGFPGVDVAATALNHGRGVIHGDNFAAWLINVTTNRQRSRAQRATQIVYLRVRLNKTLRQHADHGDDIRVTGH